MSAERCAQCGFENPPGMNFCGECGTPVPRRCPHCGAEPAPGHTSCVACGTLLTGPASMAKLTQAPEMVGATASAERRQLTVLFCDLADSTALSSQLDPEDWSDVLRRYQELCAQEMRRFGGHIARYFGDGLLVYFGYPQAHEDDPHRAVRAALGVVKAMQPLNARLQQERGIAALAVRLGIHTGLVVVGEMGGGDFRVNMAVGDTPNIAARLQALAAPDAVVVSATTYQLTEGYFACEALGSHALKGIARPLAVYRVWQETGAQSRVERAGLTPLVAREDEIKLLLERWRQARAGVGQVVSLCGEAGIGKSRLVRVLREHLATEAHHWLECRGSPYHQHSALHPVIDTLQRALRFGQAESAPERIGKLEGLLGAYEVPLQHVMPLFAALLDIPLHGQYAPLSLSPQQLRKQTMAAIVQLLIAAATQKPLVFVVEDLHWVDPSTLELLGVLLEQQTGARILTLLTFRPEFSPPWEASAPHRALMLERLPREEVETLVTRVAGGKTLPAEVCRQVVAKTDGIPLFVEELTKMVLESGLLRERETHYELVGPLPPLAIPATLHDSLMARLDRLPAVKEVAQLGATIGRDFSYELLHAIAPLDEATLQHTLARLVDADLLHQRGTPPQATYGFRHALIQEEAYQSLLKSRRQQCHQQIVQVLEKRVPETAETPAERPGHHATEAGSEQIEQLAYHAFRGGAWHKAVAYFRQAGTRALARSANREAVACFEQALEAVRNLPETRATLEQAIDLHFDVRTALQNLGEVAKGLEYLRNAERLAATLDDQGRLGWISMYLSAHFWHAGHPTEARTFGERAVDSAKARGDVPLHVAATYYLGLTFLIAGDYRAADRALRGLVRSLEGDRNRERFGLGSFPGVLARAYLAHSLAERGAFAEGIVWGQEGVHLAEVLDHPQSLVVACRSLGHLYTLRGDLSQAVRLLERALAVSREWNLAIAAQMDAAHLGLAYARSGNVAKGLLLLQATLTAFESLGLGVFHSLLVLHLAETSVLAGQLGDAVEWTERALALTRERQERGHEAWALRLRGEIASHPDRLDVGAAHGYYRRAMAMAEDLGMRPLVAHCHLGLGNLYQRTGTRQEAQEHLGTASTLYREMDMRFWLEQAETRTRA